VCVCVFLFVCDCVNEPAWHAAQSSGMWEFQLHIHTHTQIHIYTHTHTHTHMHARTHTHTHTLLNLVNWVASWLLRIFITHTDTHVYSHTLTHRHTPTHTHTHRIFLHQRLCGLCHTHMQLYSYVVRWVKSSLLRILITHTHTHTRTHTLTHTHTHTRNLPASAPV